MCESGRKKISEISQIRREIACDTAHISHNDSMSNQEITQTQEPEEFIVDFFIKQNEERPAKGLCPKCYDAAALDSLSRTRDRMICTPCGQDEASTVFFLEQAKSPVAGVDPADVHLAAVKAQRWLDTWAEDGITKAVRL